MGPTSMMASLGLAMLATTSFLCLPPCAVAGFKTYDYGYVNPGGAQVFLQPAGYGAPHVADSVDYGYSKENNNKAGGYGVPPPRYGPPPPAPYGPAYKKYAPFAGKYKPAAKKPFLGVGLLKGYGDALFSGLGAWTDGVKSLFKLGSDKGGIYGPKKTLYDAPPVFGRYNLAAKYKQPKSPTFNPPRREYVVPHYFQPPKSYRTSTPPPDTTTNSYAPPAAQYGRYAPSANYGPPPSNSYGAPPPPTSYAPPPSNSYGAPAPVISYNAQPPTSYQAVPVQSNYHQPSFDQGSNRQDQPVYHGQPQSRQPPPVFISSDERPVVLQATYFSQPPLYVPNPTPPTFNTTTARTTTTTAASTALVLVPSSYSATTAAALALQETTYQPDTTTTLQPETTIVTLVLDTNPQPVYQPQQPVSQPDQLSFQQPQAPVSQPDQLSSSSPQQQTYQEQQQQVSQQSYQDQNQLAPLSVQDQNQNEANSQPAQQLDQSSYQVPEQQPPLPFLEEPANSVLPPSYDGRAEGQTVGTETGTETVIETTTSAIQTNPASAVLSPTYSPSGGQQTQPGQLPSSSQIPTSNYSPSGPSSSAFVEPVQTETTGGSTLDANSVDNGYGDQLRAEDQIDIRQKIPVNPVNTVNSESFTDVPQPVYQAPSRATRRRFRVRPASVSSDVGATASNSYTAGAGDIRNNAGAVVEAVGVGGDKFDVYSNPSDLLPSSS